MAQDLAFSDNSQLARNKTPQPRITPRVRDAILLMVNEGMRYNEAAAQVGLTTEAMRLALQKPHVLAAYRSQCDVLRNAQRARNIHRLAQIRDADDNMPAVNAIKALEQLADDQSAKPNHTTPGVTIRIVNVSATPAQQTIEAKVEEPTATGLFDE